MGTNTARYDSIAGMNIINILNNVYAVHISEILIE